MTSKQSTEQSSSDPELRKILHSCVQEAMQGSSGYLDSAAFDKAEQRIKNWHLQKCRSYLVEKVEGAPIGEYETGAELDAYADGFNAAIDTITKRIEGGV